MSVPKSAYTSIVLLNIRSVYPKLSDILQDQVSEVDVLCLTETWLSPSQLSPTLKTDHIVFRCDRTASNTKHGVLISAPKSFSPTQILISALDRVECVSIKLVLPTEDNIVVSVVYHPPSAPLNNFLIKYFSHHACSTYQLLFLVILMKK